MVEGIAPGTSMSEIALCHWRFLYCVWMRHAARIRVKVDFERLFCSLKNLIAGSAS